MSSKRTYADWYAEQSGIEHQLVTAGGQRFAIVEDGQYTWACTWADWKKALAEEITAEDDDQIYGDFCTIAGSVTDPQRAALEAAGYTLTA